MTQLFGGFEGFDAMFNALDDLVNGHTGTYTMTTAASGGVPWDCSIDQTTKEITFSFALAGYKQDDIDLEFENDSMVLSVRSKNGEKDENIRFLKRGIKRSSFTEKFFVPLSKYNHAEAKASFKDGILVIKIPVAPAAQSKKVNIEV